MASVRRLATRRAALWLSAGLVSAGALWVVSRRPAALEGRALADRAARVMGVVHVHTTLSDGGGSPAEVVDAARTAGLAFVFITDHNNLTAKPLEGYHDGVLLGVGTEISTTGGHLLALGLADPQFRFGGEPDQALDDARLLGAAAFLAHPISPRSDFNWTDWSVPGPWGIELLNGDSQWRTAGWARLAQTAGIYALNPRYALLRSLSPPQATLARWDQLLAVRDVPGLAGADAHSRVPVGKRGLRFPSYAALFGLVRNHVMLEGPLSGDGQRDLAAIITALRLGRSYLAVDALAPADEFDFVAELDGRRWGVGRTVAALPGLRLLAGGRMPAGAEVRLLRDGRLAARGLALEFAVPGPGVYRVEVLLRGAQVPWIVTNPIYVFDSPAADGRRAAAAWSEPRPAPPVRRTLEDFEQGSSFAAEADGASSLNREVARPGLGVNASAGGLMEFRLSSGEAHGWCALFNRRPHSFASSETGLVLAFKADGLYRLWLQLRDLNPRGSDDGNETWLTSVRTSTEWQRVAVPFARLRSLDPHSDGSLDLGHVTGIGLVLDGLTVKPGTHGTIVFDEIGTY